MLPKYVYKDTDLPIQRSSLNFEDSRNVPIVTTNMNYELSSKTNLTNIPIDYTIYKSYRIPSKPLDSNHIRKMKVNNNNRNGKDKRINSNLFNSQTISSNNNNNTRSLNQNTILHANHGNKIKENHSSSPLKKLYLGKNNKKMYKNPISNVILTTQQNNDSPNNNKEIKRLLNKSNASFEIIDFGDELAEFSERTHMITKKQPQIPSMNFSISLRNDSPEKDGKLGKIATIEPNSVLNTKPFPNLNHIPDYIKIAPYTLDMNQNPFFKENKTNLESFRASSSSKNPKTIPHEDKALSSSSANKKQKLPYSINLTKLPLKSEDIKKKLQRALEGKKSHIKIIRRKNLINAKKVFNDINTLTKVIGYLKLCDCIAFYKSCRSYNTNKKIKKIFEKYIFENLLQPISSEELHLYFKYFIDFPRIMILYPNLYQQKLLKPSIYERDINQDFDRTFPDNGYFDTYTRRESLKKVLIAISNTIKNVGYIQGMNCIVGALLLNFTEEESYWILFYLMQRLEVKELFSQNFKNINILNHQLHYFTEFYFPEISNYLNERGMEVGYFSTAWFITLFSCAFSDKLTIKCWCMFLLKGYPFLIQLSLAIFAIHKDDIILRECDEAGDFLKHSLKHTEMKVFEFSFKFKVTKRLLNGLQQYYDSPKKPNLRLTPVGKKLEWVEFLKIHDKIINQPNKEFNNIKYIGHELNNSKNEKSIKNDGADSPSIEKTRNHDNPRFLDSIVNAIKIDFAGKIKNLFGKEKNIDSKYPVHDNQFDYGDSNDNEILLNTNIITSKITKSPSNNSNERRQDLLFSKENCNLAYNFEEVYHKAKPTHTSSPNISHYGASLSYQKPSITQNTSKQNQSETATDSANSQEISKNNYDSNCMKSSKNETNSLETKHNSDYLIDNTQARMPEIEIFKQRFAAMRSKICDLESSNLDPNANIDESGTYHNRPEIYDPITASALTSSRMIAGIQVDENIKNKINISKYMMPLTPSKKNQHIFRSRTPNIPNIPNDTDIDENVFGGENDRINKFELQTHLEWFSNTYLEADNQRILLLCSDQIGFSLDEERSVKRRDLLQYHNFLLNGMKMRYILGQKLAKLMFHIPSKPIISMYFFLFHVLIFLLPTLNDKYCILTYDISILFTLYLIFVISECYKLNNINMISSNQISLIWHLINMII